MAATRDVDTASLSIPLRNPEMEEHEARLREFNQTGVLPPSRLVKRQMVNNPLDYDPKVLLTVCVSLTAKNLRISFANPIHFRLQ